MRAKLLVGGIILLIGIALILVFFPASYVRVGYGGETSPEKIKISAMNRLERNPFIIYYDKHNRSLAEEVAGILEQIWRIPQERLGLALGSFRVALIVPKEEATNWNGALIEMSLLETIFIWIGWQSPIFPLWFPYNVSTLQELGSMELFSIYWAIPHEAMENSVVKKIYHDRSNRWIGDGLSEYVSFITSGELAPKVQASILRSRRLEIQNLLELEENRTSYNLIEEFLYGTEREDRVEVAGYGVSLAFWLQIAQKHGEGVIKTFWQRLSQQGFPTAKEAARILSELTGEDIWAKLQKMDLHEVLRTLEQAGTLAQP